MTPYTSQKLGALADFLEFNVTGGQHVAIIITDGYDAPSTSQDYSGVTTLTWEGRELGMVIGARPGTNAWLATRVVSSRPLF